MIRKKICMLGAFQVGKTSLVRQFVYSIFSERYPKTMGVQIDKKTVRINSDEMILMLWDIHGEEDLRKVQMSYLRGASGYLLVIDGTRHETIQTAVNIHKRVKETIGEVPYIVVINKRDLEEQWEMTDETMKRLSRGKLEVFLTSAKTGENVEEAFLALTKKMLAQESKKSRNSD